MHLVVLNSWQGDAAALSHGLAAALGRTVPEVKSRLLGAGPVVVASFGEREPAAILADQLRSRGFGDVAVLPGDEGAGEPCLVRDFALGGSEITVTSPRASYEIPYDEIELFLRGTRSELHFTQERGSTREFSAARALLSGGLMITRKVSTVRTRETEERKAFLNLYAGARPVVTFVETELRFRSLGAALQPSRQANFQLLIDELRRRAPAALYDDRLLQRSGQVQLLGPGLSPDRVLDVGIAVLARTLRGKG
ncbi:MAG TPA: hypothetical protein VGE98_16155 [Thermoanaerobaculia bacterium]